MRFAIWGGCFWWYVKWYSLFKTSLSLFISNFIQTTKERKTSCWGRCPKNPNDIHKNIHSNERSENTHSNERSDVVSSPQKTSRSGLFFLPWSVGAFWSVKKKKLFERSEFFFFSGKKYRSRQKNADGEFSFCFVFLLFGQKKNEKTAVKSKKKGQKTTFFALF